MTWSPNGDWLVSADNNGMIKYWQSNMNNLKAFNGHNNDAIRDLSCVTFRFFFIIILFILITKQLLTKHSRTRFAPSNNKFVSCADDGLVKIWDFSTTSEERTLKGHGSEVKSAAWHPHKALIVSGAKDNLVKLWDPKSGKNIHTLHSHKNAVLSTRWSPNGNWLATGSRDSLVCVCVCVCVA